ncbi:sensor histidine kinase [Maribellus mangrovi]|uniref:sensor histidine kinase n=1 Tax=Maribellus mangrovi TaxID=3133146 RepID=UPI0030EEB956
MNHNLENIREIIQQDNRLSEDQKNVLLKSVKAAEKEFEITSFKLDRTEKVKRTTAILLEETIEELEKKRNAIEQQNRELEIEAALEKVRSRSLAMHHTSELQDVINTVHQQLKSLNIAITGGAFIAINKENKADLNCWGAGGTAEYVERVHIPFYAPPIYSGLIEGIKKGPGFFTEEFPYEEKMKFFEHLFKHPPYTEAPPERKKEILSRQGGYTRSSIVSNHTTIFIINHHGRKFSEEENDILRRFGKVFEQSYTRFLDLRKAEAQAREAQIEAARERVRSRSMAMRKSEELNEVVSVVFEQLQALDFAMDGAAFIATRIKEFKGFDFWMEDKTTQPARFRLPYYDAPSINDFYDAWDNKKDFVSNIYGKEKNIWFEYAFKHTNLKIVPQDRKEWILAQTHLTQAFAIQKNSMIGIHIHHAKTLSDQEIDILKRFSKVFEQAYTRILDLQKAEEQAREAEIEAALERVRARTITMQKYDDLLGVLKLLADQLVKLGIPLEIANFSDGLPQPGDDWNLWFYMNLDGDSFLDSVTFPHTDHPFFHRIEAAIDIYKNGGSNLNKEIFTKKEKDAWIEYSYTQPKFVDSPQEMKKYLLDKPGHAWSAVFLKDSWVSIIKNISTPFTDEEDALLRRFAKIFGQAYTRFQDLKKAEKQAREAEIEMSLERVRAKAMAMRNSSDIPGAVAIVFKELSRLGIEMERNGIVLISEETPLMEVWSTPLDAQDQEDVQIVAGLLDSRIHPLLQGVYDQWKSGKEYFYYELVGNEVQKYYELLKKQKDYRFPTIEKYPDFQVANGFLFKEGQIFVFTKKHLTKEEKEIFYRFTNVFSHTYRRYVDIVKAEKQAREAEIEMSLERIRAKAMAMRSSQDISDAVAIVFNELARLGILMERCGICIFNNPPEGELWSTPLSPENKQVIEVLSGKLNFEIHPMLAGALESWKNKKDYYSYALKGDEVPKYYEVLKKAPDYRFPLVENYPDCSILNTFNFNEGLLFAYSVEPLTEEELNIFLRFTKVFSLTFRRYQDLQKAEKQAREAQIEAALERVRARSMAMHKSDELTKVVSLVFQQLKLLNINADTTYIHTDIKNKKVVSLWIANESYTRLIHIPYFQHPVNDSILKAYEKGIPFISDSFTFEEKHSYFKHAFKYSDLQDIPEKRKKYILDGPNYYRSSAINKYSSISTNNYYGQKLSHEENDILIRVAKVFEQAYTRFLDLQKAELQARESKKQASLDRVRGEIASMRTSEDLNRITPVIWRELQALEVPFIRCGVFIVDEKDQKVKVYLSTPEGKALAALNLSFDANELTQNTLEHWRKKRIFHTHWNRQAFIEWTKSMMDIGQVQSAERYQGASDAPESLNLHFVPFKQGMLYVGDGSPLSDDNIELVKTLAQVFSIAFARYEDFKYLEEAKNKIENTLSELKAAQSQLVQSEKMASLGELTAGIAHEIQNPLNFVNNFSEVSTELLDELKEEIENGNNEEINEIIGDVIQNLEKILHHGKRAEGIVKSMLQHSRGSSGEKEITDINALADEYLRLSFHGYRAKDKSFNSDYKLELDESLPKIEVVPQDIGRVLLNLINNAFQAVSEARNRKPDAGSKDYKPEVTISTKKLVDKIEIRVTDNGPGIPEDIKEKIFQPFFTTKPTGQGTGLGLSLSYDIVKAHGGTISVESNENSGTNFIITLKTT